MYDHPQGQGGEEFPRYMGHSMTHISGNSSPLERGILPPPEPNWTQVASTSPLWTPLTGTNIIKQLWINLNKKSSLRKTMIRTNISKHTYNDKDFD